MLALYKMLTTMAIPAIPHNTRPDVLRVNVLGFSVQSLPRQAQDERARAAREKHVLAFARERLGRLNGA